MGVGELWTRFRRDRVPSRNRLCVHGAVVLLTLVAASIVLLLDLRSLLQNSLHQDIINSINYAPTAVLLGAILAVTLHYVADLIAVRLLAPPLDEIPEGFYHAAAKEVTEDIGFYRTNAKVYIGPICKEGDKLKLSFVLSSDIIGVKGTHLEKRHAEYESAVREYYLIDGTDWDEDTLQINEGDRKSECVKFHYYLEKDCYDDKHIWLSPTAGFSVHFRLTGYKCNASLLRGSKEVSIKDKRHDGGYVNFFYHGSLFANQGFSWSIKKE